MGNTLREGAEALKEVAKFLDALDEAVTATSPAPDSIERIGNMVGMNMEKRLDPLPPLAATPEGAMDEMETKVLTRAKKLSDAITEVIEEGLAG